MTAAIYIGNHVNEKDERIVRLIGSLDAGKDADIIIVDDDINVKRTIKKGRTIYVA